MADSFEIHLKKAFSGRLCRAVASHGSFVDTSQQGAPSDDGRAYFGSSKVGGNG